MTEFVQAHLVLADGTVLEGQSFGARGTSIGEVVFNTGMTGYQEVLTDASYYGQIVVQTYPLIGNYGINRDDMESRKSWVRGYVVRECCSEPSNFRVAMTLDTYLKQQGVIAICGINTRKLTKEIRDSGVINGAITTEYDMLNREKLLWDIQSYRVKDAIASVTCEGWERYACPGAQHHVVLLDLGYKHNIVQSLFSRKCSVTVVPAHMDVQEILAMKPDGIMLSNGPGDPAEDKEVIANVGALMDAGVPVFGICLGHQLAALAAGARTQKLKYGHRGANQPVRDLDQGRTYITSQNHGYAVVADSVDTRACHISHVNANDGTVEGIRYLERPCFTVQFHPEASAGPKDTAYLFDAFIAMMEGGSAHA